MDMNINNSDSDHEVVVVESNVIVKDSLQTNNAQKKEAYFTESSSGSDNEGVRYVQTGRVRNCHDDTSIQSDSNHNVYSDTDSEELCEIEKMSIKHSTSNPIPIPTSNSINTINDSLSSYRIQSPLPGRSILFSPEHMSMIQDIADHPTPAEERQKICEEAVQSLVNSTSLSIENKLKPNILSTNTITKAVLLGIQDLEQLEGNSKAKQKILIQAFNQLIEHSQTQANKLILQSYVRDGIVTDIIELVYNIIESNVELTQSKDKTNHPTNHNVNEIPVKTCKDMIKNLYDKCVKFTFNLPNNNVKIETNVQNPISQSKPPPTGIAI